MSKNITPVRISVLIDKSGSMNTRIPETLDGFNGFVKEQRKVPGKTRWTLTLFDSASTDVLYQDKKGRDVPKLTADQYRPRAMTPLLDAMGTEMTRLLKKKTDTVFVVITDGYENASREFTKDAIRKLAKKFEKNGWQIIYLGADINAMTEAHQWGFDHGTHTISTDTGTFDVAYAAAGQSVNTYRTTRTAVKADTDTKTGTPISDPADASD